MSSFQLLRRKGKAGYSRLTFRVLPPFNSSRSPKFCCGWILRVCSSVSALITIMIWILKRLFLNYLPVNPLYLDEAERLGPLANKQVRIGRTPGGNPANYHETPKENCPDYARDRGGARFLIARWLYIRSGGLSSACLLSGAKQNIRGR